ncbi:hypothetical protein HAX54_017744 [Datura stramonium]|uniref:Uncharacterized protein n=1 Tax=Datura stramonium TaxID=4076 RepID=A0ABS8S1I0_DATST|nr:hypothetical protein [Datura stramonium]
MESKTRDFSACWSKVHSMIWHLGTGVVSFVRQDMFLLENPVTFRILKLLLFNLRFGGDGFEDMSKIYCYKILFGQQEPRNNMVMEQQPSQLFELLVKVIVSTGRDQHLQQSHNHNSTNNDNRPTTTYRPLVMDLIYTECIHQFRSCLDRYRKKEGNRITTASTIVFHSVMELKSKDTRSTPSRFGSLMDVRLTSHYFYAKSHFHVGTSLNILEYFSGT